MSFNQLQYFIFLVLVVFLYQAIPKRFLLLKNLIILVSSYTFYSFWNYKFLIIIFGSTLVDYICGIKIYNSHFKKVYLYISIVCNLCILGIFKYYHFFTAEFNKMAKELGILTEIISGYEIILPIGISFYTFQSMSYTIDVYRKRLMPTKNFWFLLHLSHSFLN